MLETHNLPTAVKIIVERYWQRLVEAEQVSSADSALNLRRLLEQDPAFATETRDVWCASDYAANLCVQNPALLLDLKHSGELDRAGKSDYETELATSLAVLAHIPVAEQEIRLKQILRQFQQRQMLRIIWRDVCQKADVAEICADISALADAAIDCSLATLHRWSVEQWGEPRSAHNGEAQHLVIIGMGKLGAYELNLSSDIDLIFAYPEGGETHRDTIDSSNDNSISNQQFFTRLGQRLIDVLDTVTSDGFVFRVDMRLRPYGSEGALVCSFDAMENYYQSQGRDWERYALIKARIVAGDKRAGKELLKRLRPFVYRRYLDFSAFEALRSMKMQINKQVRRKGLSQDIKLGSGGIREVEFILQAIQLVHGGRDQRLQEPSLYKAMNVTIEAGYLPAVVVEELRDAYTFLRSLEHKLQGLANKQTQMLVSDNTDQQRIALAMGYDAWPALIETLDKHRKAVRKHFSAVVRADDEEKPAQQTLENSEWGSLWRQEMTITTAQQILEKRGFEDADQTIRLIDEFRKEKTFVMLQGEGRERFDKFMPVLLNAVSQSATPSLAFTRVMKLISAVSRRTAYLVLLLESAHALRQVVQLCAESPFVAEFLSKYPVLLDELLDGIDEPPVKSVLQEELAQQVLRIDPENFEEQMETLRYFKQSHTLQVAAAQITGRLTVMKVSDYLTFTAEAILEQVLALCWSYLVRKHGYPVNHDGGHGEMDFVVIGYGKLGGIELSYVSDLDLVFLHSGSLDHDTEVGEGQRSINSREFYTRLAQRVIMMLGTYTMSGKLYEVDMRLRPSGESGLLVSSMEAFASYQAQDAWTWEHQALVRARAVAGNRALEAGFNAMRSQTLSKRRELPALAEEVTAMRVRMRDEFGKKPAAEREKQSFVIKHSKGGIVDIEFIVQYLVLAYSADHASLLTYPDNVRILEAARDSGLLTDEQFRSLTDAYLALRSALHHVALAEQDGTDTSTQLSTHQETVIRVWDAIFNQTENRTH